MRLEIEPTKTEFLSRLREGNLVPVWGDLPADLETPISAFLKLRRGRPVGGALEEAFLLESVEGGERIGRYSFLGVGPFLTLRAWGRRVELRADGRVEEVDGDPTQVLREVLARYRPAPVAGFPRFFGGAVGYFGYDLVRQWERLPHRPPDDLGLPDCYLVFADAVVVFDHLKHTIRIVANGFADGAGTGAAAYQRAVERVEGLYERLRRPIVLPEPAGRVDPVPQTTMPVGQFVEAVARAKEYVRAGDIFQVVLSRRFALEVPGVDPLDVYRALRTVNPSPYMFFLDFDGVQLAGSSPELLVRLEGDVVETRPLAGTRPRGRDEFEDRRYEADLLADEKERAEHVMLVDLGRNDLGRVCRYGTVEVPELMAVERFSHVMHIVSDVRGRLRAGLDAVDVLRAAFPAGTVTGAPKVRAMEIIDELEPVARGPYAGAVGYIGFSGTMDTCITIRTLVLTGGRAYVQAGAGVVWDSVPEREYVETVNKAKALVRALELAGRRYREAERDAAVRAAAPAAVPVPGGEGR
ncbi:MAG: anthranilate synthase component I [Armatimonadota bacterium]|nr:anthranilate synthase component I [Armatimonadota bacterium]MDR7449539.1 anthranilate synthase component I [Armatimonadota bacterium]MDR7460067.1 anthranilate synthase component I [Armatimonadota bacterium]MDR7478702.1 anthranilate synthase component I [Armatimonadota bacterium]MDR7487970.1 anthranilate synthase component I [Armatimonadota bacterium]